MKKNKFDVFISYSPIYKNNIEKIYTSLIESDLKVWFDYWEMIPGEDIAISTQSAIDNSKLALIFYDDEYLNNKLKKEEFLYLIKQKKEYFICSEKDTIDTLFNFSINKRVIKFDYKNNDFNKNDFLSILRKEHPLFETTYLLKNGKECYQNSLHQESLVQYKKALELSDNSKDSAKCLNNIALNYQEMDNYEKSLSCYRKSLAIYEELDNKKSIAIVNNNMATLYGVLEEYDKAYSSYNNCIKINKSINNLPSIAKNYNNIATLFQRDDIEKSLEYLYMALHLNKRLPDTNYSVMINYNNLAYSYQLLDSSELFLFYYEKVLEISNNYNIKLEENKTSNINQIFYIVENNEKKDALLRLIDYKNPKKCIIFCSIKKEIDELSLYLTTEGFKVTTLYGNMKEKQRIDRVDSFKQGLFEIIITTDLGIRGLNISSVMHIFNYQIPFDTESYVSRIEYINGNKGELITIISPNEFRTIKKIEKEINITILLELIPTIKDVQLARFNEKIVVRGKDIIGLRKEEINILINKNMRFRDRKNHRDLLRYRKK